MPPRWNTWAGIQAVQLDYEKTPKERPVRLTAAGAVVGAPARIGMSGVEIETRIARIAGNVLHVKVKAAPLKAQPRRRAKSA